MILTVCSTEITAFQDSFDEEDEESEESENEDEMSTEELFNQYDILVQVN